MILSRHSVYIWSVFLHFLETKVKFSSSINMRKSKKKSCLLKMTTIIESGDSQIRCVKQHLFSEVDWWKNNGTERRKGRTGSGRRERRNLKHPCGWQWILLPKNFPFLKHFTYHYVNLIMHWGRVKVLRRNAVQCVYVLRFPWSKWNT